MPVLVRTALSPANPNADFLLYSSELVYVAVLYPPPSVPLHQEDQRIIDDANETCRQLGIFKIRPRNVIWVDRLGWKRVSVAYMLIFKEDIRLPRILMGKLDPEDWRGLIASALYYYNNYQRVSMVSFLTIMLPVVIGLLLVIALGFRLLAAQPGLRLVFTPIIIAIYLVIQLLAFRRFFRSFSGLWFRADMISAELGGKDSLLKALEKAKTVGEASGIRQPRLATWASLESRIRHLNAPEK